MILFHRILSHRKLFIPNKQQQHHTSETWKEKTKILWIDQKQKHTKDAVVEGRRERFELTCQEGKERKKVRI